MWPLERMQSLKKATRRSGGIKGSRIVYDPSESLKKLPPNLMLQGGRILE